MFLLLPLLLPPVQSRPYVPLAHPHRNPKPLLIQPSLLVPPVHLLHHLTTTISFILILKRWRLSATKSIACRPYLRRRLFSQNNPKSWCLTPLIRRWTAKTLLPRRRPKCLWKSNCKPWVLSIDLITKESLNRIQVFLQWLSTQIFYPISNWFWSVKLRPFPHIWHYMFGVFLEKKNSSSISRRLKGARPRAAQTRTLFFVSSQSILIYKKKMTSPKPSCKFMILRRQSL